MKLTEGTIYNCTVEQVCLTSDAKKSRVNFSQLICSQFSHFSLKQRDFHFVDLIVASTGILKYCFNGEEIDGRIMEINRLAMTDFLQFINYSYNVAKFDIILKIATLPRVYVIML